MKRELEMERNGNGGKGNGGMKRGMEVRGEIRRKRGDKRLEVRKGNGGKREKGREADDSRT